MKVSGITSLSQQSNSLLNKAKSKLAPLLIAGSLLIPSAIKAQSQNDSYNGVEYPTVTTEPEENFDAKGNEKLGLILLGLFYMLGLAAYKINNYNNED